MLDDNGDDLEPGSTFTVIGWEITAAHDSDSANM